MSTQYDNEKAIMPAASRSDSEVGAIGTGPGSLSASGDEKNFYTVPDERKAYFEEMRALSPEEFKEMEAKVVKKMDRTIIPWITVLYLMSFLDRVNVGAAKLVGLTTELNLDSLQYSNVSMIFFVSYVAFEVPSNLVLKKFRPSRWIPFTMVVWAIFQTSMGFATNYGQMLALRFCLGIFEAGLFPGLNFYLTGWYKRDELNKRVAVFFAGAVLAGAFGGIFGFALAQMNGVGGLQGWAWIFIIEGIITFIFAVLSFWMVHDWPEQAKFLTPVEREIVIYRLKKDQGLASEGRLTKRIVKRSLLDPKVYILMLMYIGAAEPLYSGSLFSPTIIASLGKFSVTQSLLLSTPPYVVCFITTCITAYLSDKYRRRAPFLMFWSSMAMIGFIILLAVPISQPGVLYFAVFLAVMSVGPLIATTISWTGGQFCQHYKRAIAMGLVFSAGNSGGIVSSQAYRNQDAPRFLPGHGTALAFCFLCFSMAGTLWYMNSKENKRRDAVYGPPPENAEGWEAPENLERWGLAGMPREDIVDLADNHPAWRYYV